MRKDIKQKFFVGDLVRSEYPHWPYIGIIQSVSWYRLASGDYPVYKIKPTAPINPNNTKCLPEDHVLSQCWIKKFGNN